MKKNKTLRLIILLVLIVVVIVALVLLIKSLIEPSEEKIVNNMTSMGEEIYTQYYYPAYAKDKNTDEMAEYLKDFEKTGLSFSLKELKKYFEIDMNDFKSSKKECNKTNTMVIIYPVSPYGKNDYTVQVSLDCGFSKK